MLFCLGAIFVANLHTFWHRISRPTFDGANKMANHHSHEWSSLFLFMDGSQLMNGPNLAPTGYMSSQSQPMQLQVFIQFAAHKCNTFLVGNTLLHWSKATLYLKESSTGYQYTISLLDYKSVAIQSSKLSVAQRPLFSYITFINITLHCYITFLRVK